MSTVNSVPSRNSSCVVSNYRGDDETKTVKGQANKQILFQFLGRSTVHHLCTKLEEAN